MTTKSNATRAADAIAEALRPLLAEGVPAEEVAATLISFGAGFALRLWPPHAVAEAQAAALREHTRDRR